mgnify:CR=1 FL=1
MRQDGIQLKVGDLVVVKPAKVGYYLIVGEDSEREDNDADGIDGNPLGKLYHLYDPIEKNVADMHEKWIEVINENRRPC